MKNSTYKSRRGFLRVILVFAWAVFWLNTALFPHCEAVAAAFGGYSGSVSQSTSAAQRAHDSYNTHSERRHHSPYSPCGYSLSAGPTGIGMHALLATGHFSFEWFAVDAPVAPDLIIVNHADYFAPRGNPLPPFRLYLRTLRLLI